MNTETSQQFNQAIQKNMLDVIPKSIYEVYGQLISEIKNHQVSNRYDLDREITICFKKGTMLNEIQKISKTIQERINKKYIYITDVRLNQHKEYELIVYVIADHVNFLD